MSEAFIDRDRSGKPRARSFNCDAGMETRSAERAEP